MRSQFFIGEGPIFLDAFKAVLAKIPGGESKAVRIPVDAASSNRTDAIHKDIIAVFIANGVLDLRWVGRVWLFSCSEAVKRQLIGPRVVMEILGRHHSASLHKGHLG